MTQMTKMTKNDQKWPKQPIILKNTKKMIQNNSRLLKMTEDDFKWLKNTWNDLNDYIYLITFKSDLMSLDIT